MVAGRQLPVKDVGVLSFKNDYKKGYKQKIVTSFHYVSASQDTSFHSSRIKKKYRSGDRCYPLFEEQELFCLLKIPRRQPVKIFP